MIKWKCSVKCELKLVKMNHLYYFTAVIMNICLHSKVGTSPALSALTDNLLCLHKCANAGCGSSPACHKSSESTLSAALLLWDLHQ